MLLNHLVSSFLSYAEFEHLTMWHLDIIINKLSILEVYLKGCDALLLYLCRLFSLFVYSLDPIETSKNVYLTTERLAVLDIEIERLTVNK